MGGLGGNDTVYGEGGDDLLSVSPDENYWTGTSGPASDLADGGAGYDTVVFANSDVSVVLDLTDQRKNDGYIKGDHYRLIEKFVGTDVEDVMLGNAQGNSFDGGGGDVLSGGWGIDTQARSLWFDADGSGTTFATVGLATIASLAELKAADVLFV